MAHVAFAVSIASPNARAQGVRGATSPANAASFRTPSVACSRETARLLSLDFPLRFCGGDSNGGKGSGDGGDWRSGGNGRDGVPANVSLIPFVDKLLRGSSPAAALAGYSVSTLLEERSPGALHLLSTPDFKEAGWYFRNS